MISKNREERVMVFIDLRNVLKSVEQLGVPNIKIDFESIVDELVGERRLIGAYVFDGIESEHDKCAAFHDTLRSRGFRVVVREGHVREDGEQKEVDVAMACEILSHAYRDNYDTAIIVSGDRDFRPSIEHIQAIGRRAEVAGFSRSMSWKLSRGCDVFHNLDPVPLLYRIRTAEESCAEELVTDEEMAEISQAITLWSEAMA